MYVINLVKGQSTVHKQDQESCDEVHEFNDQLYLSKGIPHVSFNFISCQEIWDKVFKGGQSKFCRRQPLKKLKGYGLSRPYPFKFFKGCLPQILLSPLLNILSHT